MKGATNVLAILISITSTVALAWGGWVSVNTINNSNNQASTTQKVDDVDARLTRIENKIDALSEKLSYVPQKLATSTSER